MQKPDARPEVTTSGTSAQVQAAKIGLIGALIVASCGLLGTLLTVTGAILNAYLSSQYAQAAVQISIHATETAEARARLASVSAATPVPATVSATTPGPSAGPATFRVKNRLVLPIRVTVNGALRGEVRAQAEQVFGLDGGPAIVRWEVVKETTAEGQPLGDEMGAVFDGVRGGAVLTVTNVVDGQAYFYPFISNRTDTDCEVTINLGWKDEVATHAVAPARQEDVGLGYFRLFTNSNVTLSCDGRLIWWGQRPDAPTDTPFYDKVEAETGAVHLILEP